MMKANLLNTFNSNMEENEMDKFLEEFGGTSYIRSYSSSCETYRSLSMFSKGELSIFDERNIILEDHEKSLKNILKKHMCQTIVIGDDLNLNVGVYDNISDNKIKIDYSFDILKFLKEEIEKVDDKKQCIFLGLELPHQIVDDYSFDYKFAGKIMMKEVAKFLKEFFQKIDKESFDNIILFSDHGYKEKFNEDLSCIDDERSKIFIHTRKKGEKNLKKDEKLRHITDIYYSILDYYNIETSGKKLNDLKGHDLIVIEDYKNWKKDEIDYIHSENIWGIRTKDFFYFTDLLNEKILFEEKIGIYKNFSLDIEIKQKFEEILIEKTRRYKKRKNALKISSIEKNITKDILYISGKKRLLNRNEKLIEYFKIEGGMKLINTIFKNFIQKLKI